MDFRTDTGFVIEMLLMKHHRFYKCNEMVLLHLYLKATQDGTGEELF